jgi:hypothetical protein
MDDLDLYEEWASSALFLANQSMALANSPVRAMRTADEYEEMASELVSLSNLAQRVAA